MRGFKGRGGILGIKGKRGDKGLHGFECLGWNLEVVEELVRRGRLRRNQGKTWKVISSCIPKILSQALSEVLQSPNPLIRSTLSVRLDKFGSLGYGETMLNDKREEN